MSPASRASPSSGRSTTGFLVWAIGLGAAAIAILICAPAFGGLQYSLPAVVAAIAGLVLAASGVIAWLSAGWVRKAITQVGLAGKTAWPVRVESTGRRWVRTGILEADQEGLTITIEHRAVRAAWSELAMVELNDGGMLRGKSIVLDGPRSGRVELEILQRNAVVRQGEKGLQECFAILESLRLEAHARQERHLEQ